MDYLIYRVVANAGDEAALHATFLSLGFIAYALSSRNDGRLDIELYGADGALPDEVVSALREMGLVLGHGKMMSERELMANVLDGEPCLLCPGIWIDPQGTKIAEPSDLVLHIPASPAFGDGHHPSTRMAAELLLTVDVAEKRVLDLGCGTGILGLIAHKRGAAVVTFSDIDDGSVRSTVTCCELNGYPQAAVMASDLLQSISPAPVDVVVANLYADLLLLVADDQKLSAILPHGTLIISGVAQTKRPMVEQALHAVGFRTLDERNEAWWSALVLNR
jgi:ribosomal protein L11 methyltransferase